MPNLTLTLEANLLKSARKLALERDTSVNQMVREFLTHEVETKEDHAAKVASLIASFPKLIETGEADKNITWKREDLYDRC